MSTLTHLRRPEPSSFANMRYTVDTLDELHGTRQAVPPHRPPNPLADLEEAERSGVVSEHNGARLRGSRCAQCRARFSPSRRVCFECGGRELEETLLGPGGTLYSYTTVHVSASRPTPYTIGYVDLDEGVRVLSIVEGDPGELRPDQRVRLVALQDGSWAAAIDGDDEVSA